MAEDLDVEAMLEEAIKPKDTNNSVAINGSNKSKKEDKEKDRKRKRSRSRDRDRKPDRTKDKERKRSRSRDRDKDKKEKRDKDRHNNRIREKRSRSKSRDRRRRSRSKSRDRKRRSRTPDRWGNGRRYRSRSRSRSRYEELPPEERDQRTVFCMQLAARVRTKDLEDFFTAVGRVREVRLIMDNKTRRHKGIAYIEFYEIATIPLALALSGQRLCGVPIIIQPTQAEKNRMATTTSSVQRGYTGPMRLYVGSLHFNITEDMLKGIFEPFGRIDKIELMKDGETNRSKGYGFIAFHDADDAKKALEQLNGFELAGRPMKVNHVTERQELIQGPSILDSDDLERSGIELGTTGRLQLMAKLAEGTGIQLPKAAVDMLQIQKSAPPPVMTTQANTVSVAQTIATQCFMLNNMFDPDSDEAKSNSLYFDEIRNDVIDECRNHGGALHVFVDKASKGDVYVKCPTVAAAAASVTALHGRWFAGRLVTAAYVPVLHYHNLFAEAATATIPL
ncbi:RNA-binding protein 39-like [Oppia nitens]|uniref:RNA-binding protein 39-like n=1 Tax=Oppia nitens TaxID=1686743 RepID=UPI0023DC1A70|nr:RNA-binding protein 39-like [Oppia nitens]